MDYASQPCTSTEAEARASQQSKHQTSHKACHVHLRQMQNLPPRTFSKSVTSNMSHKVFFDMLHDMEQTQTQRISLLSSSNTAMQTSEVRNY